MSFFSDARIKLRSLKDDLKNGLGEVEEAFEAEKHSHTHLGEACHRFHRHERDNRFYSFAPPRMGNDAKWFVDGCGYMWAVSVAIEEARESIWILDWWLSPELYLRRPPSQNESYRLDRMLLAAAERGVKVNVIIYKEVSSVLTCEFEPFHICSQSPD
jgi:phospholipase D1/2